MPRDNVRVHHPGRWAIGVAVLTVAGIALVGWLAVTGAWPTDERGFTLLGAILTIGAFGMAGSLLIDRRPDLPFGWLLAVAALSQAAGVAIVVPSLRALEGGNDSALVRWGLSTAGLWFVPIAVQGLVNLRFPSGTPSSRRARVLEVLIVVGTVLVVAGALFGAENLSAVAPTGAGDLEHPLTGGTTIGKVFDALTLLGPAVVLLGLVAGIGVVLRFRQAEGIERQQLKWRATGVVVSLSLFPLAVAEVTDLLDPFDNLVFSLTILIPVVRYRLWSIDAILRRSAVYGIVTVLLVVAYLGLTAVAALFMSERVGAALAAGGVALALGPLRARSQRFVNRRIYGHRSDPYRTISDLDRRLAESAVVGEVLPTMLETIATSLRLPYVAIERPDHLLMHEHGAGEPNPERWPIVYEGVVEGYLVASPRRGEDEFDERDRGLLADLARHSAALVHADALTADLIASRQQLVTAREEERRRLRRDLHDGLGPILTAVGLNVDAARTHLRSDPDAADAYLGHAREATTQAISDVRRVVYGLRPPALDNHGLVEAIELHLDRVSTSDGCVFDLQADGVPTLPAAVEVAAYRTVIEAVTNAVRHGNAHRCTIRLLDRSGQLVVDVEDDGHSEAPWAPGVGLLSLREQAQELGGDLTAGPIDGRGARVTARLPIAGVSR